MKYRILRFCCPSSSASALNLFASVPIVFSFPQNLESRGYWSKAPGACFHGRAAVETGVALSGWKERVVGFFWFFFFWLLSLIAIEV